MINIWKQKWRDQHDGDTLGGSGHSVPDYSGSSEPAPPAPSRSGTKRSTTQASLEVTSSSPLKRLKTDVVNEPDSSSCCPSEIVLLYDKVQDLTETELVRRLRILDPSAAVFGRHFKEASEVAAAVGTCAGDLVWRRAVKGSDDPTYSDDEDEDDGPRETLDKTRAKMVDTVKNWAFTMPNLDLNSRGFNVTPKFLRLVQVLKSCEPCGESFRGIVFVKRRVVAYAISDLIPMVGEHVGFIRAQPVTGSMFTNENEQREIFRKFGLGIYNLLIATKSIEDLDIPNATIVIRFDLFEGHVSQAFIRSCTAGRGSHLVHMVERQNDAHRRDLSSVSFMDAEINRWANILRCNPESAVPPPRLVWPTHSEHSDDEEEEGCSQPSVQDPIAGGRICLQDATTAVYQLASTLNRNVFPSPIFQFQIQNSGSTSPAYMCTVTLPGTPVDATTSPPCFSIAHARRAACYKVCIDLAKAGLLDPRLFLLAPRSPPSIKSQETERIAKGNGTYVGVQVYPCKKPDFWSLPTGPVTILYPTVIVVDCSNEPPHAPMLMLTRHPFPTLPSFKLFFSGTPAVIRTYRGAPFNIDDEKTQALYLYTLRVCRAVVNKPFVCPLAYMQYFFAPLSASWSTPSDVGPWGLPDAASHIPWELVHRAASSWATPLKYGLPDVVTQDVEDAVIQDRSTELTRRYDILRVRRDLSPLSHPEDSPREIEYESLLDYCKAVRKNFEGLKDENQAILEISSVVTGISRLDPALRPMVSGGPPPRYLIPELCFKFTIPASTFRTALLIPSITRRIDNFLLVKELNARFFDHQISEVLLDMAISAPSARLEYDYERLELLGDSFLKYLSSIYVFVNEPWNTEGALHHTRLHIISNNTLFHSFDNAGLAPYVQAKPFGLKTWQPPNFQTAETAEPRGDPSKRKKDDQRLGDKVVADVAEAILGAAYLSGGSDVALMAAKAMNMPFQHIETWSDFGRKLLIPPSKITAKLKPGALAAVEAVIKHKFKYPHLLAQALTHASVSAFEPVSYERLEFVGDAILDFLVIRHVFERDPKLSPGGLTLLKGAMVSNSALAAVCVVAGLHKHLLLSNQVARSVEVYVEKLQAKRKQEYDTARAEQRPPGQYWLEVESPKVLSDVVESVVGAIYISDNFTPIGVEAFFEAILKPFYDGHITLKTLAHHPTKTLFEYLQAQRCQKFKVVKEREESETICLVLVHDIVLASGQGSSTAIAARNASLLALDAIEGDAEFFLRICDCPKEDKKPNSKPRALDEILSSLEEGG